MNSDNADLEHWLARWASWMHWTAGELPGVPSTACGFSQSVTNYAVSETDGTDYWETHIVPATVLAVDAAIDSLPVDLRRVVWFRYGLTSIEPPAVYTRFPEAFERVKVNVLKRTAISV